MHDITDKVVEVEEDEENQCDEDGRAPGRKQIKGEIFNLPRRGEQTHIHRTEAHPATHCQDCALGLTAVTAQEHLHKKDDQSALLDSFISQASEVEQDRQ